MLIQGNVLHIPIADKKVQCVVTSPPYYGLRDYSVEGQLGLEPTLEEYIQNTVLWAREVRRVLKDDGVFWLNIGDSYAGSGGHSPDSPASQPEAVKARGGFGVFDGRLIKGNNYTDDVLKPKDLMMVPHRVAIALQNDGWWVRSDIVWNKPNPMPESVTDRPTKAHEYIFLLSKSKKYYYDQDAIREPHAPASLPRALRGLSEDNKWHDVAPGSTAHTMSQPRKNRRKKWEAEHGGGGSGFDGHSGYYDENGRLLIHPGGANKKSVWTMTTKPYSGSHFATFPAELPETCIKAGTSEKGECPECGKAWVRVTEKETSFEGGSGKAGRSPEDIDGKWGDKRYGKNILLGPTNKITTIGWKPQCNCNRDPVHQIVLDPFAGSGTTVMVANALGRKGIGLDLSWDYLQLAKERTGMKALDEWINGKKVEANLEGLPLFD